jgi:hypothetical protein
MLQLYALAILHMNKTGGFPLIDKIGGKAGKYESVFLTAKITLEFYKKSDPKNFQLPPPPRTWKELLVHPYYEGFHATASNDRPADGLTKVLPRQRHEIVCTITWTC